MLWDLFVHVQVKQSYWISNEMQSSKQSRSGETASSCFNRICIVRYSKPFQSNCFCWCVITLYLYFYCEIATYNMDSNVSPI